MEDKKEIARKVAQLIETLPPIPDNISRLMAVDINACSKYAEAVGMIAADPGLCMDLLHLANDFCYYSGETIETIDDAVEHIGIGALVQLIAVSYARKIIQKEFAQLEHLNEYLAHSQNISLSSRILAELTDMPKHQCRMYAVMGLIHDIGRLIIMVAADKTSVRLMGTSWNSMASIVHDEKEVLGLNHCDVGMQICNKWNFSAILQEGVLRHHTPLIVSDFSFPGTLIFIAHFVSFSDMTGEIISNMLGADLLSRLQLTVNDFVEAQKIFQSRISSRSQ